MKRRENRSSRTFLNGHPRRTPAEVTMEEGPDAVWGLGRAERVSSAYSRQGAVCKVL